AAIAGTVGLRPPLARCDDTPVTGNADALLKPFDTLFTKFLKDNAVPGAAVAITRNGKLVYARGFGYADTENKTPAAPHPTFRIGSVSKPTTAVGVMQLAEAGKIKLDDPALKHATLKPFLEEGAKVDERWEKVTIRQCLQHTGGWDRNKKGGFDPIAIPGR